MSISFYVDKSWKKWFQRRVRKQYMQNVNISKIPNGIIVNEKSHGFGVFDENYKFVKSSAQVRKNNSQFIPKFNHDDILYVDADAVFVGNVYPQFGHFLLEHLNRAYAFLDKKYQKMKFVLINNQSLESVPEYMFRLLELLGVPRENILILEHTTKFRNVYVPDQGFNLPVYSSKNFGKIFDKIAENVGNYKRVYDKIYLSRAKLKLKKTYGEEKVQKIFERNGYKIIYPETMNLKDQISLIKNCKYLAGCAGSALHMSLFMKPGGSVIQLKRNRLNRDSAPVQYLLNNTKKLNSIFINASIERVRTDHASKGPQIIGVNENLRAFFNDYGFKTLNSDFVPDVKALQEYNNALIKYQQEHGTKIMETVKRKFVRISSCFIPGRYNRGVYRKWLKKKFKL